MENTLQDNWLYAQKTYVQCPKCKKGLLDTRIHRGALVKLFLFWIPLKRYRCSNCEAKVYLKGDK